MNTSPWWALALRLVGLGWYVAFCIVAGVLGGLWLDKRLGTVPLFTLAGVIVGAITAFYGVYKLVVPLLGEEKARPKKGQDKDR